MIDKYGSGEDPSCYPGTRTLRNLLNIQDPDQLEEAERRISLYNATKIEFSPPPYDLGYFCKLHECLFQGIYSWAGEIRSIDISKGTTRFCTADRIVPESEKLFSQLAKANFYENLSRQELITTAAELYGDINMLHPFREGNGRAQRLLFEHIIINTGHEISWHSVRRHEWVKANIAAVDCDYSPLENIFSRCIGEKFIDKDS